MASRISTLTIAADASLDRVRNVMSSDTRSAATGVLQNYFWPNDRSPLRRLVRLLWLPWWILSDLPGPLARGRARVGQPVSTVETRMLVLLGRIQRSQLIYRLATVSLRGIGLALLIAAIWCLTQLAGGPAMTSSVLTLAGVVLVLISLLYGWATRPGKREIAVMLDQSFRLDDRITTAVDGIGRGISDEPLDVPHLQQIEATNTVAILITRPHLRLHVPWRELVSVVGLGLLVLGLYLLNGSGGSLPAIESASVPAFVPAKDRLKSVAKAEAQPTSVASSQTVQQVQQQANLSANAQADLVKLADALAGNPLTAPIADAIRAGDYDKAAAELAALAPQLDQLSPAVQNEIADNLDTAAASMSGDNPLQGATQDAADALHSDDSASNQIADLSDAIQQSGDSVKSADDLSQEMKDAREAEADSGASADTRPEASDSSSSKSSDQNQEIAGDGGDAASGSNDQSQSSDQQTSGSGGKADSSGADQQQQSSDASSSQAQGGSTDQSSSGDSSGASSGDKSGQQPGATGSQGSQASSAQDGQSGDQGQQGTNSDSQAGNGAGHTGSTNQSDGQSSSNGADQGSQDRSPDAADTNVTADQATGSANSDGDAANPEETITLSRSPDASGYKSGGSSSSSSGSGAGAAAGPGSVEQGDVGSAGPDSNSVPDQYKKTVEDYFSDGP